MSQAGSVYAQALYELAKDKGLDEAIHSELTALNESFTENPDELPQDSCREGLYLFAA